MLHIVHCLDTADCKAQNSAVNCYHTSELVKM